MEQDQALRGQTKASAREGEVHEKDDASRSQSTPHPGERPGLPPEPGPQRSDRTVRHSSGDSLPQRVTPSLAGAAGEGVDSATLAFLLTQSLAATKKEEQVKREEEAKDALKKWKARRKLVWAEFVALLKTPGRTPLQERRMRELEDLWEAMDSAAPGTSSASSSGRKKKKKRRKRRRRRWTCRC